MADEQHDRIRQKNSELVSRIYAGALNPSNYNDIFRAWDALFREVVKEDARRQSEDFQWMEEYIEHFEQAGELFDKLAANSERPLEQRIFEMPYSAYLCSLDGKILKRNHLAKPKDPAGGDTNIFDLVFDPQAFAALRNTCAQAGRKRDSSTADRLVLRLCECETDEPEVHLAEIVEDISQENGELRTLLLVRGITAAWNENVARAMSAAFELTNAELELVALLYRGLSIKEIAEWKDKSQATLRTQLSSVLGKTGTKNQSDLSRIVSGLVQVLRFDDENRPGVLRSPSLLAAQTQTKRTVDLADGTAVEVVESGDLSGQPFYFIQTSSSPALIPEIVDQLAIRGIRLVAPIRSGLGNTTRKPISVGPVDWAKYHLELMERLDLPVRAVGGHRCGGVYAMELARLIGADCSKLLLVDTGAPLTSARMINQMPASPKRLFLAARYFPPAIRTPYKLVTSDFFSGPEAEARLVEYFFDGSPADQAILYEGDNWKTTRDNIEHCLRNAFQTAQDVTHWSRDNSATIGAVLKHTHVRFLHGEENMVHRADNIVQFCQANTNTSFRIVDDRGQLLIYVEPELFAEEISTIAAPE